MLDTKTTNKHLLNSTIFHLGNIKEDLEASVQLLYLDAPNKKKTISVTSDVTF